MSRILRHQSDTSVRFGYKNYGKLTDYLYDTKLASNCGNSIYNFIDYYRRYGHLSAQLDPL